MSFLKVERVHRNDNCFVRFFLDDGRDLFDAVMPSLPILVIRKIEPAKYTLTLRRLARPVRNGMANLRFGGASLVRLLARMVRKPDRFHFRASSSILISLGARA